MARKESDVCLLCKKNAATQRNSHIVPKFMSSSFLGEKSNKRGYDISSESGVSKKPLQDSPKEDFLVCPECESYFSLLETLVAPHIKAIHQGTKGEVVEPEIIECTALDPTSFHLFFYSIFWRASASHLQIFAPFKLEPALEEKLRINLLKFFSAANEELEKKLEEGTLDEFIPYGVTTSLTFSDPTKNVIFASGSSDPWTLNADKFGFIVFRPGGEIPPVFAWMFNTVNNSGKVALLPQNLWDSVMVEKPLSIIADGHKRKITKQSELRTLADQLSKLTNKEAKELRELLEDLSEN